MAATAFKRNTLADATPYISHDIRKAFERPHHTQSTLEELGPERVQHHWNTPACPKEMLADPMLLFPCLSPSVSLKGQQQKASASKHGTSSL